MEERKKIIDKLIKQLNEIAVSIDILKKSEAITKDESEKDEYRYTMLTYSYKELNDSIESLELSCYGMDAY
ncbi:MAG: hypothetical protein H2184_15780 [Candidatus Galacturonibacter soehngenii]|nr:hypothetical protein [Candidatus Galacturonibacter soehngenii]